MDSTTIQRGKRISIDTELSPETYVSLFIPKRDDERFMPGNFVSVCGLPVYEQLTREQILEIERHEATQFMYSHVWSETLAARFLGREISRLSGGCAATKFMYREIIEDTGKQEMFARGIEAIKGSPILPSGHYFVWSKISRRFLPNSFMFMAMIAGELVSDAIGREVQKDKRVYSSFRKIAELHQVEERQHIYFAANYLGEFTQDAGLLKRSLYAITVAVHIHFIITMYVKKEIFDRAGVANSRKVYKMARKNYRDNFTKRYLFTAIDLVKSFNGFNRVTKFIWRKVFNSAVDQQLSTRNI